MTNFEKVMEAARKANEEITKLEERNAEIRKEIGANKDAKLNEFKNRMKHISDAFFENKVNFPADTQLLLDTGLVSESGNPISIKIYNYYTKIGIHEDGWCVELQNYGYVKDYKFAHELDAVLDCMDSVVKEAEKSFIRQLSERVDNRFQKAAKANDALTAEWEREFTSDKPFHIDEWTDRDIVKALETAGKPATRENIDRMKEAVLDFLQYDATEYKMETLLELITEVIE